MKLFLTAAVMVFGITALAEGETECSQLPKSQQDVFAAFNAYVKSGSETDADFFAGAIGQYQTDIDLYGDKSNANFGNIQSVDIYESSAANLCIVKGGVNLFESRALKGDRTAIKLALMYSAVYIVDGAGAEDLGELQLKLKTKYPSLIKEIQRKNAAFFKAHPINWVQE